MKRAAQRLEMPLVRASCERQGKSSLKFDPRVVAPNVTAASHAPSFATAAIST